MKISFPLFLCMLRFILKFYDKFLTDGIIFVVWSSWEHWSCSVTCGNGTESRTRRCTSGDTCRGSPRETRQCVKEECPSKNTNSL